ncbi:MAG: sugar-binding protein [Bacteroidota bacterium]
MNYAGKYRLVQYIAIACLVVSQVSCKRGDGEIRAGIVQNEVKVDGSPEEWGTIRAYEVNSPDDLWIGQGMVLENWKGEDDLSFRWRSCWDGEKIYFLFEVKDDLLVEPAGQTYSWLNDCIEIMIDPSNTGGARFTSSDAGKQLYGYEMHFLPASPNHVFVNDSIAPVYSMEFAQDSLFLEAWDGEFCCIKSESGYIAEIGFRLPGMELQKDMVMGLDVDVCDDDGEGRKSLMIWSGTKKEFWLNMDEYPKVVLK